jgi:hypothetical protein
MSEYKNLTIALATIHNKEKVIAPAFRHALNADVIKVDVNTDQLGTFSGEVERIESPSKTVLKKTLLGINSSDIKRGLATEGSFHPHPLIPWLAIHHEIICFVDLEGTNPFSRS